VRLRAPVAAAAAVAVALGAAVGVLVARDDEPDPTPTPGPPLGQTELAYLLTDRFDPIFFCDPDFYPVGSDEGERTNARTWWTSADRDGDEVTTILAHLGLSGELDDEQALRAYREHKRLMAIGLEPDGAGLRFALRSGQEQDAVQVTGMIARDGTIRTEAQEPANTACPICLQAGTLIDTPDGRVPIAALRPGMRVWTADEAGLRIEAIVLRTSRRAVGSPSLLVRVTLADGRNIVASAAHPTADGSHLGALLPGGILDGSGVTSVQIVPASGGVTYDLLPSGPTGSYWADGVLVGSTLG